MLETAWKEPDFHSIGKQIPDKKGNDQNALSILFIEQQLGLF